jgi:iron complex transport system permease protein
MENAQFKSTSAPMQAAVTQTLPRLGVRRNRLLALLAALVIAFVASLVVGSVSIPLPEVVTVLFGGEPARATWKTIVLDFRLPKALTALLAGAALGVSGLQMQTLFRNPLAEPYVLGVNAGASLGVALVVLAAGTTGSALMAGLGFGWDVGIVAAACIGAGLVLMLVLLAAQRVQSVMTLLILGLMFGFATSAVVSLLMYFSIAERIQRYIAWTFGSFSGVTWRQMPIFALVIIIGLAGAAALTKSLNAMLLGEAYARSMGLNVRLARLAIIITTALLSGVVTAFCGPIAFLGIAVPHLCRTLFHTSDHRVLIPAAMLMGGLAALTADIIAQAPGSQIVLPLNAITALIGAPIVVWMVLRQRNLRDTFAA